MIPDDAWPAGDRLSWSDDESRLHYDFTAEPWATTPYTAEENAAADERAAEVVAESNHDVLVDLARAALADNRIFLASTPSNAPTVAQVKALTRQMNAIIRLVVGDMDGTN